MSGEERPPGNGETEKRNKNKEKRTVSCREIACVPSTNMLASSTSVTGWKGTRDKESSNQKPRRVDFINPCSGRGW